MSKNNYTGTFYKLHESTLSDPLLRTSSQRIIYSYYITRSRKFGKAWPSRATVARDCGLDESTAKRAIKHLRAIGYLRITERGGVAGRFYDTNRYTVKKPISSPMPAKPARTLEEQQRHDLRCYLHYASKVGIDASISLETAEAAKITRELRYAKPRSLKQVILKEKLRKLTDPA